MRDPDRQSFMGGCLTPMKTAMNIMGVIEKFIALLSTISGYIILGLMLMISVDVVLRILGTSILGSVEIVAMSVPVIVFLGAGYTALNEMHIRVDIIKRWPHMDRFFNLLCIAAIGIIGWYGWGYGLQAKALGIATNIAKIPRWPVMVITSFGMFIIAVAMTLNEIKAYMNIYKAHKEKALLRSERRIKTQAIPPEREDA